VTIPAKRAFADSFLPAADQIEFIDMIVEHLTAAPWTLACFVGARSPTSTQGTSSAAFSASRRA
jgi:hypothetical protein